MSLPYGRNSSRFSILVLSCGLASACAAPSFKFRDPGLGLSGLAQAKARDRCDGKIGYSDYRECTNEINTHYDAWRSQQKQRDIDSFKKFQGRP
jgi:hypothetical protein